MYAIVDIETTGGNAAHSGITEIAIYLHDGQRLRQHFTSLINPLQAVPSYITALTGISNAMVASAPSFAEVASTIFELLSKAVFVAHNVNFDFSFIHHQLKQCGYTLQVKKLCTVRLARKVFVGQQSYSLGRLCQALQIPLDGRHRADGDAKATVLLFEKILQNDGLQQIDLMLKRSSYEQWLPMQLDKQIINTLPTGTGVYFFHDAKGTILYVGKALNIKKRVTSHFTHTDVGNRRQNFIRLVAHITYKICANELHALILESTEIKKHWPKYNYSQKQPLQKYALYSFEDNRGYLRLAIDKKKKNLQALYNFNLLTEGQVLLRKMVEEFELNEKLCYINKAPFAEKDIAFTEAPNLYNAKVKNAILTLLQKLPTFAVADLAHGGEEKICFLIEKGNFWGMGFINSSYEILDVDYLKEALTPYRDNDFIRNSIYDYAQRNPDKKIILQSSSSY